MKGIRADKVEPGMWLTAPTSMRDVEVRKVTVGTRYVHLLIHDPRWDKETKTRVERFDEVFIR